MRNLFLPGADLTRPSLTIEGADAHHLRTVLRARSGERLTLLDDRGGAVEAEVVLVGPKAIEARVVAPAEVAPKPSLFITVAQALGKGDRFEQVLQHATEAGASGFVPLLTERSVVRLDAKAAAEKTERWQRIVKSAAEQSGRARLPACGRTVTVPDLAALLKKNAPSARAMALHPGCPPLEDALRELALEGDGLSERGPELTVIVGPEGGFTDGEVDVLVRAGAIGAGLGPHILRTETAAVVAVAQILFAHRLGVPFRGGPRGGRL